MSEEFFNSTLLTFVEDEVFDVSEQKLRYFSHKFINFSVLLSGMMFGQEKKDDVLGERVGFIGLGIWCFDRSFSCWTFGRLPWVFAHVALLTFIITLFGLVVKVVLGARMTSHHFFTRLRVTSFETISVIVASVLLLVIMLLVLG